MFGLIQIAKNLGGALQTPPLSYCSGTLILAYFGVCCQGTTTSKMRKSGVLFRKFGIFFLFPGCFAEMVGLEGSFLAILGAGG
jgi:hypothetical protein